MGQGPSPHEQHNQRQVNRGTNHGYYQIPQQHAPLGEFQLRQHAQKSTGGSFYTLRIEKETISQSPIWYCWYGIWSLDTHRQRNSQEQHVGRYFTIA